MKNSFWSVKYKQHYYIQGHRDNGKQIINVSYSPSGYGYEWKKDNLKSVHAAKLAATAHQKTLKKV